MLKNALLYVLRKRNRTVIVFIILSVLLSFLYACLSVQRENKNLEQSLYKSANSSLSIVRKDNGYFRKDEFKKLNKIKENYEIILTHEGKYTLINKKVISASQAIKRDDIPTELKNLVSVEGTNDTKKNILFSSNTLVLKEGRHITKNDKNKILIHEKLSKKNNLKLKDKITLKALPMEILSKENVGNDTKQIKEQTYEIVGIFSGKKHEKYTGVSSDLTENTMFTDYTAVKVAFNYGKNIDIVNKIMVFSDSYNNLSKIKKEITKSNFDSSKYEIRSNQNEIKNILDSVKNVKNIINMMTYLIMIAGSIVLSLILALYLRERIYEIGIYLSIGLSKIEIISKFILELLFTSIPAVIVSIFSGNLILTKLMSMDLNQGSMKRYNILNNMDMHDKIITFIKSYGILFFIIFISVVVTSGFILRKRPKEILSQIS